MTEGLPAIITRAGQRPDARNSGELLEAKKLAEAALRCAKVTKVPLTRRISIVCGIISRVENAHGQRN
jgi:hypothetical protein